MTTWDRALPGWAIDVIRDGVPSADLRASGSRAVWRALVSTAMSAQVRGHDSGEWECLVLEPASRLGGQVRLKDRHKARTDKDVAKMLTDAWDRAWEYRTENPTWDRDQVQAEAAERAAAVLAAVADADADLSDRERAVLTYAAQQTQERGMLRVALPWRAVMAATNLTEKVAKRTLADLQQRGLLHLDVRGYAGATKRKANLYSLPAPDALSPYLCRGTRPMGPGAQTYGTSPDSPGMGPPPDLWDLDAAPSQDHTEKEPDMSSATLTLTLTPTEQAAVLDALARVRQPDCEPERDQSAQVIPMRPAANG